MATRAPRTCSNGGHFPLISLRPRERRDASAAIRTRPRWRRRHGSVHKGARVMDVFIVCARRTAAHLQLEATATRSPRSRAHAHGGGHVNAARDVDASRHAKQGKKSGEPAPRAVDDVTASARSAARDTHRRPALDALANRLRRRVRSAVAGATIVGLSLTLNHASQVDRAQSSPRSGQR